MNLVKSKKNVVNKTLTSSYSSTNIHPMYFCFKFVKKYVTFKLKSNYKYEILT